MRFAESLIAVAFSLIACAQEPPESTLKTGSSTLDPRSSTFEKGIALGLYSADPDHSYVAEIEEIAALGADSVSLIVVWMQGDIASTEIRSVPGRTVSEERLVEALRAAERLNLHTLVFPIVLLEKASEGEWRGRLAPVDLDAWFASYGAKITALAQIAEREGAESFSIGSELSSLEKNSGRWRELIAAVRARFSGRLTYTANWDHLRTIDFWSELDFVGVSAYFELATANDTPEDWLTGAWEIHRDRLLDWHAQDVPEMPLVITEVGYASQDGIAQHPWNYTLNGPLDLEEQRQCYAAFIRAWDGVESFRGVYFYEWGGDGGGSSDTSYTPKGKPAEDLIRAWFTRGEVPPLPASTETKL
jgi:hypothetical protein